ncbi:MAG: hypothetical protein JKY22_11175 [Flavobacteriaceae bacterium]|nr:hypothetical protein [Flavobacteriaceae bacterium]
MFKNKTTSYILILIVASLWGALIYKFAKDLSDDVIQQPTSQTISYNAPKTSDKEKFDLIPIDKDPFLGTLYQSKTKTTFKASKNTSVNWPQIIYKGWIEGEKNSTFIVQINGQDQIFNRGEEFIGVKLVRGNSKKVTLSYEGTTKDFKL